MNFNIILIFATSALAIGSVYLLYSIVMAKGIKAYKGDELQLSTKNVLEQVKHLFDNGEYKLVELLAVKYLDRVPNHNKVRAYLAKAYFNTKFYSNAIKQIQIILEKEPGHIEMKKMLGDCYLNKKMYVKAIKEYEEIFDYRMNDPEVVRTLAELYRETEQIFSSISVYNILGGLLQDKDEIAELQTILADLNEEVKDYPAAFEAYKTRLDIYPTDVETNKRLVELYILISNYPKAIETLTYMLTFVTESKMLLWVYENLVDLYVKGEDYQKAIEYSEKLVNVPGADKFNVEQNIATYNIMLGNYQNGIAILEDLSMLSNGGYDVTVELAKSYIVCEEYEKALDKYMLLLDKADQKEAKKVRHLICELHLIWGIKMRAIDNIEESIRHFDLAENYNMLNPEVYYNKAINGYLQKNYGTSIELLQKALEYDKSRTQHTKYLLLLSEAHHELGNFFEEKKALTDLLNIDDKHAEGLYKNGLMYISLRDLKNAEEFFKRALEQEPNHLEAKFNLALIYETNSRDKAKELYIELLEQDPSFEKAKIALADLENSNF